MTLVHRHNGPSREGETPQHQIRQGALILRGPADLGDHESALRHSEKGTPHVSCFRTISRFRCFQASCCWMCLHRRRGTTTACPSPHTGRSCPHGQPARRGRPLEHILGWADFCGQRITVTTGVFLPRRRTELLARYAASVVRCVASRNLEPMGAQVYQDDLYRALPAKLRGHIDVLIANAPYVPTTAIKLLPTQTQTHEPLVALDGGPDGLQLQRRVATAARQWLTPSGGHLLIETNQHQLPHTVNILADAGLRTRVAHCEKLEPPLSSDPPKAGHSGEHLTQRRRPAWPAQPARSATAAPRSRRAEAPGVHEIGARGAGSPGAEWRPDTRAGHGFG